MGLIRKAALSSEERDKLPDSDFVYPNEDPSKRRYPIPDISHARNALARVAQHGTPSEQEKVRAAVHSRYPSLGKKVEKSEGFALDVDLFKGEREGKFYGIVLAPDREDSQGDIPTAEAIEKAAHEFMREYSLQKAAHGADVQHGERANAGIDLIENVIAPQDLRIGDQAVPKGAWYQGWQTDGTEAGLLTKQEIEEGKRTGLSLEGTGVRTAL